MADDVLTIMGGAFVRALAERGKIAAAMTLLAEDTDAGLRAALAALAEAGGFVGLWRTDMENAPRDGKDVLLRRRYSSHRHETASGMAVRHPVVVGFWRDTCWCVASGGFLLRDDQIAAWAALPAPPGERK